MIQCLVCEEKPKTQPGFEPSYPKMLAVAQKEASSRVLVISPYTQFNDFLKNFFPGRIKGSFVEVISSYEKILDKVHLREAGMQKPLFIIDFQSLLNTKKDNFLDEKKVITKRRGLIEEELRNLRNLTGRMEDSAYIGIGKENLDRIKGLFDNTRDQIAANWNALRECYIDMEIFGIFSYFGYFNWSERRKLIYLSPKQEVIDNLKEEHGFDEKGNFLPDSVDITVHLDSLEGDLEKLVIHGEKVYADIFDIFDLNSNTKLRY